MHSLLGLLLAVLQRNHYPVFPYDFVKWIRTSQFPFFDCILKLPDFFKKLIVDRRKGFIKKYGQFSKPCDLEEYEHIIQQFKQDKFHSAQRKRLEQDYISFDMLLPKRYPDLKELDYFAMNLAIGLKEIYRIDLMPSCSLEMLVSRYCDLLELPSIVYDLSFIFAKHALRDYDLNRSKQDKYAVPLHVACLAVIGIAFKCLYKLADSPVSLSTGLPTYLSLVRLWITKGFLFQDPVSSQIMHSFCTDFSQLTLDAGSQPYWSNLLETVERIKGSISHNVQASSLIDEPRHYVHACVERPPSSSFSTTDKYSYFSYNSYDIENPFHFEYSIWLATLSSISGYSPSNLHFIMKKYEGILSIGSKPGRLNSSSCI